MAENFFFAIFVTLVAIITVVIGWLLWQLGTSDKPQNNKKGKKS